MFLVASEKHRRVNFSRLTTKMNLRKLKYVSSDWEFKIDLQNEPFDDEYCLEYLLNQIMV